jgi:hypothetical protein
MLGLPAQALEHARLHLGVLFVHTLYLYRFPVRPEVKHHGDRFSLKFPTISIRIWLDRANKHER